MKQSFESEAHNNGLVNRLCMTFASSLDTHMLLLQHFRMCVCVCACAHACTRTPHSEAAKNTRQYARMMQDGKKTSTKMYCAYICMFTYMYCFGQRNNVSLDVYEYQLSVK